MASQSVMLKASGLNTNYQSLMEVPPGALLKAQNIVINRVGIVEPRRGMSAYYPIYSNFYSAFIAIYDNATSYVVGNQVRYLNAVYTCKVNSTGNLPTDTTKWTYAYPDTPLTAKQLFEYKGQILAHTSDNNLAFLDTSTSRFSYVNGATTLSPPNNGYRLRYEESKGNFFITNSNGVKKISAKDSYDITNAAGPVISNVGVAKAISPVAFVSSTASSGLFFSVSTSLLTNKVAYRVLFIKTDNNNNPIFGAPSNRTVISNPSTTLTATVGLRITLPKDIYQSKDSYKVRVYRSEQLLSSTADPSDELYQVYESELSTAQPSIEIVDSISDIGRSSGVPLYTNANSGEGILKANDVPPSAADISLFKGHMFYANTKTKESIISNLTDVTKLTSGSNLILSDGTNDGTESYTFNSFTKQISVIAITTALPANYTGYQIQLFSGNNERKYAFWLDGTVGQTTTAPTNTIPAGYIAVKVNVYNAAPTSTTIATAINAAIAAATLDFTTTTTFTATTSTIIVTNVVAGACSTPYWDGSVGVALYSNASQITVASNVLASFSGFQLQMSVVIANILKRYSFWMDGTVGQTTPTPAIPSGYIAVKVNVYNAAPTTATIATAINSAIIGTSDFTSIYPAGASIITAIPVGSAPDTATWNGTSVITLIGTSVGRGDTAATSSLQVSTITVNNPTGSDYSSTDNVSYNYLEIFETASTDSITSPGKFVVWFDTTGSASTPTFVGTTLIKATVTGLTTTAAIAAAINTALIANANFNPSNAGRIFNVNYAAGTSVLTVTPHPYTNIGSGANAVFATNVGSFGGINPLISTATTTIQTGSSFATSNTTTIAISTKVVAADAIEETSRSLVKVINNNQNSKYTAQYLSNYGETPGKIYIEKKYIDSLPFVVTTFNPTTTLAFTPNIGISIPNAALTTSSVGTDIVSAYNQGVTTNLGKNLSSLFVHGVRRKIYTYATTGDLPAVGVVNRLYYVTNSPTGPAYYYIWDTSLPTPAYALASSDYSSFNGFTDINDGADSFTNQRYFRTSKILIEELEYTGFSVYLNDFRGVCLFKSGSEVIPNRIYYSKYQEHEAVPLLNYIDVGSRDQQILRIIQLRESLFLLKEDGVYRLAGDPGPNPIWDVGAFDTTTIIRAPDTAITLGNQCYFLSNQGMMQLNESSIQSISLPINDKLLPLITTNSLLPSLSFSVSYESDKSFLLWTVKSAKDTTANICYRYNYVTDSWTEWSMTKTCGIVSVHDDKMYLGSGTDNYIEIERKSFSRFDYSDREVTGYELTPGALGDKTITNNPLFLSANVGDVCVQTQYITFEEFNRLLNTLDIFYKTSSKDYYETVKLNRGDDLLNNLTLLMYKLEADEGFLFSTYGVLFPSADPAFVDTFAGLQTKYNEVIYALRRVFESLDYVLGSPADPNMVIELKTLNSNFVYLAGYIPKFKLSMGSSAFEAMVTSLDNVNKLVNFRSTPSFMEGPFSVLKSIPVEIEYAPQHAGDPSTSKQFSDGTFMFETKSFSHAEIAYNSDISSNYEEIPIDLNSYSIFGAGTWGEGTWGGLGDQAEIGAYIPLKKQRCRFLGCKFIHNGALESFSLYGLSLTFRTYAIPNRDYK